MLACRRAIVVNFSVMEEGIWRFTWDGQFSKESPCSGLVRRLQMVGSLAFSPNQLSHGALPESSLSSTVHSCVVLYPGMSASL